MQIAAAFDGIELGDGTTIGEAYAIDDSKSPEVRAAQRAKDTYRQWQDIDVASDGGGSAMTFMNARGWAFHAPAYAAFFLRHDTRLPGGIERDDWVSDRLDVEAVFLLSQGELDRIDALSPAQRAVIVDLIMLDWEIAHAYAEASPDAGDAGYGSHLGALGVRWMRHASPERREAFLERWPAAYPEPV